MTDTEVIYAIVEPLRDLNIVDAEKNGLTVTDPDAAKVWIRGIKRDVVQAIEEVFRDEVSQHHHG